MSPILLLMSLKEEHLAYKVRTFPIDISLSCPSYSSQSLRQESLYPYRDLALYGYSDSGSLDDSLILIKKNHTQKTTD